jgi:hypothetical protein
MTLEKREDTVNLKRKQSVTQCTELDWMWACRKTDYGMNVMSTEHAAFSAGIKSLRTTLPAEIFTGDFNF